MALAGLAEHISGLYNSKTFSDVVIKCGDREWDAHQAIICTQSEYFRKAFNGGFREAQTGEIVLSDETVLIEALLKALYTGDYCDAFETTGYESSMLFNVRVFATAEKFFVAPLLPLAAKKFRAAVAADSIKSFALIRERFPEAMAEWSTSTLDPDKILGGMILSIIIQRKACIWKAGNVCVKIKQAISEIPWLAGEVNEHFGLNTQSVKGSLKMYRCPCCPAGFFFFPNGMDEDKPHQASCRSCNVEIRHKGQLWKEREVEVKIVRD